MSVLVEGWIPVGLYADLNLKLEYTSGTAVRLHQVDDSAPAYVPVFRVGGSETRMAKIPENGLPIVTSTVGVGGLDVAGPVADTGYDVYVLVKDDLSICAAIACIHGDILVKPAGWGALYASNPIRYFCCNVTDGEGEPTYDQVLPFVETRTRETFYACTGLNLSILEADDTQAAEVVKLADSQGTRKAQFPATARKVWVEVFATNTGVTGRSLGVYLDGGTTPVFSLGDIGAGAGLIPEKNITVEVPCQGNMDTTALWKGWSGAGTLEVTVYALGYQL